jgi:hypothetical protein
MSMSHLKELRAALVDSGWKIVSERLRGEDDVEGASTWEVRRVGDKCSVLIDFTGFGPMGEDISLEESYACAVRGRQDCGLYFRRINRSRELWLQDLSAFISSIGRVGDA